MSNAKCAACSKTVYSTELLKAEGKAFHRGCLKCKECQSVLNSTNFFSFQGNFFCQTHYKTAITTTTTTSSSSNVVKEKEKEEIVVEKKEDIVVEKKEDIVVEKKEEEEQPKKEEEEQPKKEEDYKQEILKRAKALLSKKYPQNIENDDNDDDNDGNAASSSLGSEMEANVFKGAASLISSKFVLPKHSSVVRVFLSSTFTDMEIERNELMKLAHPFFRELCQLLNLDFQVVDFRWGMRDESTDDHRTSELCLAELRRCLEISVGASFVAFLGNKYGYRPFPSKIPAHVFEALRKEMEENSPATKLVDEWFKLDSNSNPHLFVLQSISAGYPDYLEKNDEVKQSKAASDWWTTFVTLQSTLRTAAGLAFEKNAISQRDYDDFVISVTEDEVRNGIYENTNGSKQSICFLRNITDVEEFIGIDKKIGLWVDPDEDARKLLVKLKNEKVPKSLPSSLIVAHNVSFLNRTEYIHKNLVKEMIELVSNQILEGYERQMNFNLPPLMREVMEQADFIRAKGLTFVGRENLVSDILGYLSSPQSHPLIVTGESGSGKTSLIAKCILEMSNNNGDDKNWKNACVVARFCGSTVQSTSIVTLTNLICQQLEKFYQVDSVVTTNEENGEDGKKKKKKNGCEERDIVTLTSVLHETIFSKKVTEDKPLIIIIDSVDQLTAVPTLQWLPDVLPPNMWLIISTIPPTSTTSWFNSLKEYYPEGRVLNVERLSDDGGTELVAALLKNSNRTLTEEQQLLLSTAAKNCPLPLYLKLLVDSSINWRSYSIVENVPKDTTEMIVELLEKLERKHGKLLTSHALAFLSMARSGLDDHELEDVLSCDDIVLNDLFKWWVPPVRRLPPLLWIRLRTDLGSYLIERTSRHGSKSYGWYHKQFRDVVLQRYLTGENVIHLSKILALYFSDKLRVNYSKELLDDVLSQARSDKHFTPFIDRQLTDQPLWFENFKNLNNNGGQIDPLVRERYSTPNIRVMEELPSALITSKLWETFVDEIMNADFISAKIRAGLGLELIEELKLVCSYYKDDEEMQNNPKLAMLKDVRQLLMDTSAHLFNEAKQWNIAMTLSRFCPSGPPCVEMSSRSSGQPQSWVFDGWMLKTKFGMPYEQWSMLGPMSVMYQNMKTNTRYSWMYGFGTTMTNTNVRPPRQYVILKGANGNEIMFYCGIERWTWNIQRKQVQGPLGKFGPIVVSIDKGIPYLPLLIVLCSSIFDSLPKK